MVEQFTQFGTTTLAGAARQDEHVRLLAGRAELGAAAELGRRRGARARAARAALRADRRRQRVRRRPRPRAQRHRLRRRTRLRQGVQVRRRSPARSCRPTSSSARATSPCSARSCTRSSTAARNALGDRIRVGGQRYRVIGIMESKGDMVGIDLDDTVYIPAARGLELFNRQGLLEIDVLYAEDAPVDEVVDGIKRILAARHGAEDFTVVTQQQMLDVLGSIVDVLTLGVAALGGISLARRRRRHLHDHDDRRARANAGDRLAARDRRAPFRDRAACSSAKRCCCRRSAAPAVSRWAWDRAARAVDAAGDAGDDLAAVRGAVAGARRGHRARGRRAAGAQRRAARAARRAARRVIAGIELDQRSISMWSRHQIVSRRGGRGRRRRLGYRRRRRGNRRADRHGQRRCGARPAVRASTAIRSSTARAIPPPPTCASSSQRRGTAPLPSHRPRRRRVATSSSWPCLGAPPRTSCARSASSRGKIIVDPTNPRVMASDGFADYPIEDSNAERIARLAPGAHVVKAFSTLGAETMLDPKLAGGPVTVPIVGDDRARESARRDAGARDRPRGRRRRPAAPRADHRGPALLAGECLGRPHQLPLAARSGPRLSRFVARRPPHYHLTHG